MEEIYAWVRNITCYLILTTVMGNLLPSKKYEKYLKLFAGMVLILLVMQPLTSGLRLEDKITYFFESISFKQESDDLKKELLGMENKRLNGMISQYEGAVAMDIEAMVKASGFCKKEIKVTIESDQESEQYGMVTAVVMVIGPSIQDQPGETGQSPVFEPIAPVSPIEPVEIKEDQEPKDVSRAERRSGDEAVNSLKSKISDYYNLEAEHVEIQLEYDEG